MAERPDDNPEAVMQATNHEFLRRFLAMLEQLAEKYNVELLAAVATPGSVAHAMPAAFSFPGDFDMAATLLHTAQLQLIDLVKQREMAAEPAAKKDAPPL